MKKKVVVVKSGPYSPEYKFVQTETRSYKVPKKAAIKMKMLPQTPVGIPVGMSNAQTSAKFVPQAKKPKREKI